MTSETTSQDPAKQPLPDLESPALRRGLSLVCLGGALACVLWGLIQLDGPITRYLRTITTPEGGGTLTVPWMAFVSHVGNWIGDGRQILTVSAILLAVGWLWPASRGIPTGIQTLWAHGLATVSVHTVKHLIGRPRPKFSHSGEWTIAPSLTSGFDSFPSGHTTATFALAVVLSRRFPVLAALFLGVGAFVALSRVLRGSHFPSDVFGGWVLGALCGSVSSAPWKEWRRSLEAGLHEAALGTVWMFALVWALAYPMETGGETRFLIGIGAGLLGLGVWIRVREWRQTSDAERSGAVHGSQLAMGLGLSFISATPIVMAAAGFLCVGRWLRGRYLDAERDGQRAVRSVREAEFLLAVGVSLLILFGARGVLPFGVLP